MFDLMFNIFPLLFFVVVIFIVIAIIRGIGQWHTNNQSPVLTVAAKVTSKRTDVTYHQNGDAAQGGMMHASTTYYVTFEVESGDRMEFSVSSREYGLLCEGDKGRLTFQGTRYKLFDRNLPA